MTKTRRQTGNITIKKEEEDSKPTLGVDSVTLTARNKITKQKPCKTLPSQQVKVEEKNDIKPLSKPTSSTSKLPKGQKFSQEQINQLIRYIVNDSMSITKAAQKANISRATACVYYNLYKNDPEKKIPSPKNGYLHPGRLYTQEHIENLIRYITHDNMTIQEASAKADMSRDSARYYYNKYVEDPNHNIPIPRLCQNYTQDQKEEFIGYVINNKMSINAASKKAKLHAEAGRDYYHKYFNEQNPGIARPSHIVAHTCYTQEQIKELINYIVDGEMTIKAASKKANMDPCAAGKYYRRYLKDNKIEAPAGKLRRTFTQDEKDELIGYIVDDGMSIKEASAKLNMCAGTGLKHYNRYLKDYNLTAPLLKFPQERIDELIGYIVDGKMSVMAASKKANMSNSAGHRYYHQYLKDNHIDIPKHE